MLLNFFYQFAQRIIDLRFTCPVKSTMIQVICSDGNFGTLILNRGFVLDAGTWSAIASECEQIWIFGVCRIKQQGAFFFQIIVVWTIKFMPYPTTLTTCSTLQREVTPFATHEICSQIGQFTVAYFTGKAPVAPLKGQPPITRVTYASYAAFRSIMIDISAM